MRTSHLRILGTMVAGLCSTCTAPAAESLSVLLQKAIYAEETEGNLDSAIKLYEQIAAEMAANRPLAAQAQYRLAVCYQKQGKREQAVVALKDLLKHSPLDTNLTQKARTALGDLGSTEENKMRIYKVALPDGAVVSLSPDHRFVAYRPSPGSTAISINDCLTGKNWPLKADNYRDSLSFSVDGRRIAYRARDNSIHVSDTSGSDARSAYTDERTVSVLGWTANSRKLVILPWDTTPLRPKLLDVQTQSLEDLPPLPESLYFDGRVSPDGRYLTSRALGPGDGYGTISLIDLDARKAHTRIEKDLVAVVGWSPQHGSLLFTSHRSGTIDLWALEMKEGRLQSEAYLVRRNVGDVSFKVASHANLYYWESNAGSNVFVVKADFQTGEVMGEAQRVMTRPIQGATQSIWSKDGETLLLCVNDPPMRFIVVSPKSGEQREYPAAQAFVWKLNHASWIERGSHVFLQSYVTGNESGIYRYDLASGSRKPFAVDTKEWNTSHRYPESSPDGRYIYYIQRQSNPRPGPHKPHDRIVRQSMGSDRPEVVFESTDTLFSRMAVAPEGNRLALKTTQNSLKLVDLTTRTSTDLPNKGAVVGSIAWTPDGKRLLFVSGTEVWSLDVDTKQAVRLRFPRRPTNISELAIHPDGRRFAFTADTASERPELWVMEGFLGRTGTSISAATNSLGSVPLDDIMAPENHIAEKRFGVTAQLPSGCQTISAFRSAKHVTINFEVSDVPAAEGRLAFNGLEPTQVAPHEIDAWLRRWAETTFLKTTAADYKHRPATFVPRTIGGRRALSWVGDFTKDGIEWTQLSTLIYTEQGHGWLRVQAPASTVEKLRASYEAIAATVRVP